MKKIFILACVVISFSACNNTSPKTDEKTEQVAANASPEDAPKVKFEQEIFDFKTIQQGEKVHYDFKFTNTGKSPLIITNATATCGCTQPEFPKEPVKPGEEGLIKVTFNSEGKQGMQDKVITLTSNANPEANQLHLVGEVKVK